MSKQPKPIRVAQIGPNLEIFKEDRVRPVAVIDRYCTDDSKERENADFIVLSWNSHSPLISVCEEMTESICSMCKRLNPQHENCTSCQDMDLYRQVLRDAKGVQK